MGWDYCEAWRSKAQLVAALKSTESTPYKVLESSVVGNTLYMAVETEISGKYVVVVLMACDRRTGWWGYKWISEEEGPYEFKCPAKVLKAATPGPVHEYAVKWREGCQKWQAEQAALKCALKALKVGDKVSLKNRRPNGPFQVVSLKPLRGVYNGITYRLPKTALDTDLFYGGPFPVGA